MTTLSLLEVQAQLPELIHKLTPGDEVVITENNREVARLLPVVQRDRPIILGGLPGSVLYMAEDFDAPLEGFGESDE
jgi:antitoxin (DNA-binding transcriptional repressor) of toxin-antitoxin stability system